MCVCVCVCVGGCVGGCLNVFVCASTSSVDILAGPPNKILFEGSDLVLP